MSSRIAITGVSLISALGSQAQDHLRVWRQDLAPEPAAPAPQPRGPVTLELKDLLGKTGWRHVPRSSLMAVLASKMLLTDPKVQGAPLADHGVALGYNCDASIHLFFASFFSTLHEKKYTLINPTIFLNLSNNTPASHITIANQCHGPVFTVTTGFSAGVDAMDIAATALRGGHAPVMLAGAVQEINPELIQSFSLLPAGPGGILRDALGGGVAVGEGCALLRLEEKSSPDAQTRAWIAGFGQCLEPAPTEAAPAALRAARQALEEARLQPQDLDAVFWAANGSPLWDQTEARALRMLFADRMPPSVALKGFWGETYHAGGAMATAAAVMCLEQGFLPPTPGLAASSGAEALGFSTKVRPLQARHALVLALDRDQKAAALILSFPGKV